MTDLRALTQKTEPVLSLYFGFRTTKKEKRKHCVSRKFPQFAQVAQRKELVFD